MGLRDLLTSMSGRRLSYGEKELPPLSLSKAVEVLEKNIARAGGNIGEPAPVFIARIKSLWRQQRDLSNLPMRDLRGIAFFLHQTDEENTDVLADDEDFFLSFLRTVEDRPSSLLIRTLTSSFFIHFGRSPKCDMALAKSLNGFSPNGTPPRLQHFRENNLIDPKGGPAKLARLLEDAEDIPDKLSSIGFDSILGHSGFVGKTYELFCRQTASSSDPEKDIRRLMTWAISDTQSLKETFPDRTAATADALLLPWSNAEVNPPKSLEARIKDFLISSLGDPRFKTASARWNSVSDEARLVLKRWMNRASVSQFFDIVDETLDKPVPKRMWRSRRAFWTAYLEEVEDAWVVFGKRGAEMALDAARRSEDHSLGQFGQFNTGGASPTQAVLILTIGDLTIAEWSHMGKCRMWTQSDKPIKPYERYYSVHKLRDGEWQESHVGDETHRWHSSFAEKIRRETGVIKRQTDYRV
jgi:EH signature protein